MQSQPDSPFSAVIGLGPLKSQHPYKGAGKWGGLIFGGLCFLAAPALTLLAIYLGYDAYNRYGVARVDNAVIPPLIFAGIAFLLGALVLWNAWNNWPLAVNLYEDGFAYNDRKGLQQVRWDQIEAVWQAITKHYRNGIYTGTTHVYTVKTTDGRKLALDDRLAKVEDLGKAVQSGSIKAVWPKYSAALQAGQRLTFGPLAIDNSGIYSGNKSLRWDEIQNVKLAQGNLSIKKKEGGWFSWASAAVPQIPNFYAFYDLVGRFTKIE